MFYIENTHRTVMFPPFASIYTIVEYPFVDRKKKLTYLYNHNDIVNAQYKCIKLGRSLVTLFEIYL